METKLEMARRHVLRGRRIVELQRQTVQRLRGKGADSRDADTLLKQFEQSLAIFEDDLEAAQNAIASRRE